MKFSVLAVMLLISINTFASSIKCEVRKGDFANDSLVVKSLRLESSSDSFNMLSAKKMVIDVFGQEETLSLVARTASGNSSKLDFNLDSHPDQVKAVLLLDRAYGRITKKVNGLLVITGTGINFTLENPGAPMLAAKSLVYNIACKL